MNTKKIAVQVMDRSGLAWLLKPLYAGRGVIVGLHRVRSVDQPSLMPFNDISVDVLSHMLAFFQKEGYDFIHLSEVQDRLRSQSKRRFVVFTLDDGYLDNLTNGLPLFRAFNAPFTVFVVTGVPDRTVVPWWTVAEDLALVNDRICLEDDTQNPRVFPCGTFPQKLHTYIELTRWGFRDPAGLSRALIRACETLGLSVEAIVDGATMSWNQLRELNQDPLSTIGVHTVSHLGLTTLSDDKAYEEIAGAQNRLQTELGSPICHVAYPFGWHGAREVQIVHDLGFTTGVTVKRGVIRSEHRKDPLVLPRILPSMVAHGGMAFVRASVYGLWNQVANLIDRRN